jgi:NAD(P)-dependent dehydrogenase (short-subunit alcohol dehydrogenase family)
MDLGLKGKRALVTGSTAGIEFAIARLLAREGAYVYVNGRTEARVNKAIAEIGAHIKAKSTASLPTLAPQKAPASSSHTSITSTSS